MRISREKLLSEAEASGFRFDKGDEAVKKEDLQIL